LREARAAASVHHPNVASVFHLGRTGENYFYAMEFVEGETLERLVNRSGRLGVKLALELRRRSPPAWLQSISRSSFTGTSNPTTSW
jgi:serine/threonine protein kinase